MNASFFKLFLVPVLGLVIGLSLSSCGRGARDSLLLTGLRGKPDETRVTLRDDLVLPSDDRVVVPNSSTPVDAKRNSTYKVHEILFGDELAQQELDRQLQIQQQNALSASEVELLRSVRSRREFESRRPIVTTEQTRRGFSLNPIKWFQR